MTPFQAARQVCLDRPEIMPFEEQLAHYGEHGYIWSSPTAFILATYHATEDEWFIGLAAGNMAEFCLHAPHPAKWVCFIRDGRQTKWDFSRIQRLTNRYGLLTKETRSAATITGTSPC